MITNKGYVSIDIFVDRYEVNKNHLFVLASTGNTMFKRVNGKWYIDEKSLVRRKEFRKRLWLAAHEYYFDIAAYFGNDSKFAKMLEKYTGKSKEGWIDFLRHGLFAIPNDDMFRYKVKNRLWVFFFITRAIIRIRDRRIKAIYERLPNRDRYDEIYIERGCVR